MSHGFSWLPSWPCLQSRPWRQAHQGFSPILSSFKPDEILRLSMPVSSERAQEDFTQVLNFVDAMRNQVISQPLANLVYPSSNMTEMKDLLLVLAEFYLSKSSIKLERQLLHSIVNLSDAPTKLKAVVSKAALATSEAKSIFEAYMEAAEVMLEEDVASNKAIGSYGATHILQQNNSKKLSMLTHCNTGSLATDGYGTSLGVIRALHSEGSLERAYCTETRPFNQGSRLTAYELVRHSSTTD